MAQRTASESPSRKSYRQSGGSPASAAAGSSKGGGGGGEPIIGQVISRHQLLETRAATRLLAEPEPRQAESLLAHSLQLERFRERRQDEWTVGYYFGVLTQVAAARCASGHPQQGGQRPASEAQLCALMALAAHALCYHTGDTGTQQQQQQQGVRQWSPATVFASLHHYPSRSRPLLEESRVAALARYLAEMFDSGLVTALLRCGAQQHARHYQLHVPVYGPCVQRQQSPATPPPPAAGHTSIAHQPPPPPPARPTRPGHAPPPPPPPPPPAPSATGLYPTAACVPQPVLHALYHDLPAPEPEPTPANRALQHRSAPTGLAARRQKGR